MDCWPQEATGFFSISGLSFPTGEKGGKKFIEMLAVYHGQDMAIGHLAGHLLAGESKALC
ncbi:hypothetical protein KSC_089920 [Ktedonobacter sp. SOSP1-52]|nr:hypothetical protein KSC_089920 [Ktedonobacter sp. SOSP1-52]